MHNDPNSENKLPQTQSQDEAYMLDAKAALLGKGTPWANGILYTILLLLVIGIIWAYFGTVEQLTIGEGKVIPSSEVKIIQSLDGGIITQIDVDEGQTVKKNQVLMRLDDTRYRADFNERYAKYLSLLAMTARLRAEAYGDNKVTYPDFLIKNQPQLVQRETTLFNTKRNALLQEIALLHDSLKLSQQQINMYKPLVEKGVVAKIDLLRALSTSNDIQSKIIEKQNAYRNDSGTEYLKQNAELSIVIEELKSLRDKITRATLYSPVYGIVKKLNIYTIGGVVTPGANIMEIVPLEDTLLIQAKVQPKDIAFIHVGQPAIVRLTAYDYTIYGSLNGTVEYISPDAIEDSKPSIDRSFPIYYLVNVRTSRSYLGSDQHKLPIIAGMTATVHINTGEKRVLDYLLKPLLKAKEEALRER